MACQHQGVFEAQQRGQRDQAKTAEVVRLDAHGLSGHGRPFLAHANYLTLDLPYEPYRQVLEQLQRRLLVDDKVSKGVLQSRGEAHVTVVTPPEFSRLQSHMAISEIDEISRQMKIQDSRLEGVCLGEGQAEINGRREFTYFVVVRSNDLLGIRREIEKTFRRKGGDRGQFHAESYYPHVTIGFTKTDLHESDGVIKSEQSCVWPLAPIEPKGL
jgi:2'-5' RNA ligase